MWLGPESKTGVKSVVEDDIVVYGRDLISAS